jgi:hypothetical protein
MRNPRKRIMVSFGLAAGLSLTGCGASSPPDQPVTPPDHPATLACGTDDTPETGIQGDVPREDQDSGRAAAGYNCGLSLVAELPASGATQGYDHCAYVRVEPNRIVVFDISDPLNPTEVTTLSPAGSSGSGGTSETIRVVATSEPPLLASGSSLYDISDCDAPVHKGDIDWPGILPWPAGLSHDIRIAHNGKKVYAGIGVLIADIGDLDNPANWTVRNETCRVAAQFASVHFVPGLVGLSVCDGLDDVPRKLSHGSDGSGDGTRLYIGNQGLPASLGDLSGLVHAFGTREVLIDTIRIVDLTQDPPKVLAEAAGPGHSVDWFRIADGREFILHANELVLLPQASCAPHPRPSSLGFAFEAFITEVTGDRLVRRSMLELDINKSEHCAAKLRSGRSPAVAYHSIDNPFEARFAMVSFGDGFGLPSGGGAGLRVFDIRDPSAPREVAYFNRGGLQHASATHYDRERGLLYMPGADATRLLELQPQIIEALGLGAPTDPAYPRFPRGRAAQP